MTLNVFHFSSSQTSFSTNICELLINSWKLTIKPVTVKVFFLKMHLQIHIIVVCFWKFAVRASLLTHGRLVVAHRSAAVVMFEQRAEHLGAHLRFPPE